MSNKKKIYAIFIFLIIFFVFFLFTRDKKPAYVERNLLTDVLGDDYVILHKIINKDERLGVFSNNVANSDWYFKNEGYLLRNYTIYCSNRLIDNIAKISTDAGIQKYQGDYQKIVTRDDFKKHVIKMNSICVNSKISDSGEKILEVTWLIGNDHKIWKKNI
jgi:hypothetical protein